MGNNMCISVFCVCVCCVCISVICDFVRVYRNNSAVLMPCKYIYIHYRSKEGQKGLEEFVGNTQKYIPRRRRRYIQIEIMCVVCFDCSCEIRIVVCGKLLLLCTCIRLYYAS